MLAKKYLLSRSRIAHIQKKGEQGRNDLFLFRYLRNRESHPRFCAIVSRKLYPKAVERNRLRRQIYESIRNNLDKLIKASINLDIVFIPKKNIIESTYQEIEKAIINALNTFT